MSHLERYIDGVQWKNNQIVIEKLFNYYVQGCQERYYGEPQDRYNKQIRFTKDIMDALDEMGVVKVYTNNRGGAQVYHPEYMEKQTDFDLQSRQDVDYIFTHLQTGLEERYMTAYPGNPDGMGDYIDAIKQDMVHQFKSLWFNAKATHAKNKWNKY